MYLVYVSKRVVAGDMLVLAVMRAQLLIEYSGVLSLHLYQVHTTILTYKRQYTYVCKAVH